MAFPVGCYPKSQRPLSVPFVGVLDGFTDGLTAAWDHKRRLLSSYEGPAFLARADRVGQPTTDIPFKPDGTWDTDFLLDFAAGDSVYKVTAYDQSGHGRDLANSDAALQPRVVNAGVLEEGSNFEGGKSMATAMLDMLDLFGVDQCQVYSRVVIPTPSTTDRFFNMGPLGANCVGAWATFGSTFYWDFNGNANRLSGSLTGVFDTWADISWEKDANANRIRVNGTTQLSGSSSEVIVSESDSFVIGTSSAPFHGQLSSMVLWSTCTPTLSAARNAALAAA